MTHITHIEDVQQFINDTENNAPGYTTEFGVMKLRDGHRSGPVARWYSTPDEAIAELKRAFDIHTQESFHYVTNGEYIDTIDGVEVVETRESGWYHDASGALEYDATETEAIGVTQLNFRYDVYTWLVVGREVAPEVSDEDDAE